MKIKCLRLLIWLPINIFKVPANRIAGQRVHLGFRHELDKMAGTAKPQKKHNSKI